jgi:hypothetical protein
VPDIKHILCLIHSSGHATTRGSGVFDVKHSLCLIHSSGHATTRGSGVPGVPHVCLMDCSGRSLGTDTVRTPCPVPLVVGPSGDPRGNSNDVEESRIVWGVKVKKVKLSRYTPWRHMGGERRCGSYSFLTSAVDGSEWSASRPGRALPPGKGPPVPIG